MEKKFKVVVEKGQDGYFIGEVPELPGCYSQGKTLRELTANIKEAIELYVESMRELKEKPEKRFVAIKEVVVNA
ncbi:MAG: type II toxin-antitoxin system HicB family antitoxin [Candidatus Diapherotrites archaeon]|nr:type II toxin-antitoxin system HicB family antitoxin [Candidatus Micrarchaeota archaeon]MBU1939926.1 type II toxin-antitoxin system HicB family antitoxin [Candidatus Micrarchaeota archaeon]